MIDLLKQWDRELFIYLNGLGIESNDAFWLYVTQIESWIPLFALFIFLFFYFFDWRKGATLFFFVLLTFGITILFTNIVKEFVARLRPNNVEAMGEIIRILQKPTNYSFFSGHASSSFSITTFVVLALRKETRWIFLAFLWPFIFVLSRIYVGVHYPSDIAVGALVGSLMAYIFYLLMKVRLQQMSEPNPGDSKPVPDG